MAAMDSILSQVDDRDLVDAERSLLEASRERIGQLDAQIKPLEDYEAMRDNHVAAVTSLPRPERLPAAPQRADGGERLPEYRSVGHYLVDLIRARAMMGGEPDREAARRVELINQRVVADQKTTDTAGVLPQPIVGAVVDLIDASRP